MLFDSRKRQQLTNNLIVPVLRCYRLRDVFMRCIRNSDDIWICGYLIDAIFKHENYVSYLRSFGCYAIFDGN